MQFKNAPNQSAQDKILKEYGVRWSELLRLRYWDPTKFVVIDGMHNLFLGLVQNHVRTVLGTDLVEKPGPQPIRTANAAEMELARSLWAKGVQTASHLKPINLPGLQALCYEHGIAVPCTQGKKLVRQDFVSALLNANKAKPPYASATDINPAELLPGLIDDNVRCRKGEKAQAEEQEGRLGHQEMRHFRKGIMQTRRPVWQESPPPHLGTKSQGKLKADQWRTFIEFDLPVTLVQLWVTDSATAGNDNRQYKIVENTMHLAIALRWATTHHTSQGHVDEYMHHMRAYLRTLRELFPAKSLKPNHHNALYLGEMLLRFGPARGWWMFPFERVIGLLQKFNTNNKMGNT